MTSASARNSRWRWPPESVPKGLRSSPLEPPRAGQLAPVDDVAGEPGEQLQRLADAQPVGQRRGLQLRADERAQPGAVARRVEAEHVDAARVAAAQALDDLDRGRLAGAVAPGDAEDLARADLKDRPRSTGWSP